MNPRSAVHVFDLLPLSAEPNSAKCWNLDWPVGPGANGDDARFAQYLLVHYAWTHQVDYSLGDVDGIWGPRTSTVLAAMESRLVGQVVADGYLTPIAEPRSQYTVSGKVFKLGELLDNYLLRTTGFGFNELTMDRITEVMIGMPDDGLCPPELAFSLRRQLP